MRRWEVGGGGGGAGGRGGKEKKHRCLSLALPLAVGRPCPCVSDVKIFNQKRTQEPFNKNMLGNSCGLMDGRCEVSGAANLERSAKKIKKPLKSLKATAALPKDHHPIERLGVMSRIEI